MRERVLKISIGTALDAFATHKWKFYEIKEQEKIIRIEVPKTDTERLIVEVPYEDEDGKNKILKQLKDTDFFQQEIRYTAA